MLDVVDAHVRRFNAGVRDGDWEAYGDGFAPDATVTFDGVPVPPMVGRAAIVAGYRAMPPDDTITVLSVGRDGDAIVVAYAWDAQPSAMAGRFDIEVEERLIVKLTVRQT